MRISFLPLLILALPLMEIAGFVVVGQQIGALATIGLVLASAIAGSILLRHQGFGVMARVRSEMDAGRDPSKQLAHGVMILLASILLIAPGFITSCVGLLLFIPPLRDLMWRFVKSRVGVVSSFSMGGYQRREQGTTIDLDSDDYTKKDDDPHSDNNNSPWTRLPKE